MSIVDEDVELAQHFYGDVDGVLPMGFSTDVVFDEDDAVATRSEGVDDFPARHRVTIGHGHRGTFGREELRTGASDAHGATSDERHLPR